MSDDANRPSGGHQRIEVERTIPARIDDVWVAWTTASGLATWWWSGWDDTTYAVDASEGGAYRIAAPSAGIEVAGVFVRLDRPHRIEMTWIWSDEGGAGPEEVVVVQLSDLGDSTQVRIDHSGPWSTPEPAANYTEGWHHVLGQLAAR